MRKFVVTAVIVLSFGLLSTARAQYANLGIDFGAAHVDSGNTGLRIGVDGAFRISGTSAKHEIMLLPSIDWTTEPIGKTQFQKDLYGHNTKVDVIGRWYWKDKGDGFFGESGFEFDRQASSGISINKFRQVLGGGYNYKETLIGRADYLTNGPGLRAGVEYYRPLKGIFLFTVKAGVFRGETPFRPTAVIPEFTVGLRLNFDAIQSY